MNIDEFVKKHLDVDYGIFRFNDAAREDVLARIERSRQGKKGSDYQADARFVLHTATHYYTVLLSEPSEKKPEGMLMGFSGSRISRIREDWQRGNDIAEGPLTTETWCALLSDIVGMELANDFSDYVKPGETPAEANERHQKEHEGAKEEGQRQG